MGKRVECLDILEAGSLILKTKAGLTFSVQACLCDDDAEPDDIVWTLFRRRSWAISWMPQTELKLEIYNDEVEDVEIARGSN